MNAFKRRTGLLLCLALFLTLAACKEERTVSPIVDAPVNLQETQELVIYIPNNMDDFTVPHKVTEEFRAFYSDVDVTLEYVPEESYGSRIATEIMAGGGPDIIFPSWLQDSDLYKMMDSGAFLNLNQIIEQDTSFRSEDYVDGILEAAQYKGGQYLIPLSYRTAYLLSSEESLTNTGFSENDLDNIFSFLEASSQITQNKIDLGDQNYMSFIGGYSWTDFPDLLPDNLFNTDISLVDYETKTILPYEEDLRKWLEAEKNYSGINRFSFSSLGEGDAWYAMTEFGGICKGAYSIYFDNQSQPYQTARMLFGVKGEEQTPFIHGLPGREEKKISIISESIGINSNSENQQNAWDYIKLALTLSSQGSIESMDYLYGFPVLKAAYFDKSSMIQSWLKPMGPTFEKNADRWGCHFNSMTEEEWDNFIDELSAPGKVLLPESGPVKAMFKEAVTPYFTENADLNECINNLKNQLQLYVSE